MNASPQSSPDAHPAKPAMAQKWLIAILVVTFAFVIMPFLLWYLTTFSRPLTDSDLAIYFHDAAQPRRAQHALSQVADRIMSPIASVRESAKPWYPEVIALAGKSSDELRITAAWVMGQDNQSPEFHATLLKMLADPNPMVQRNAALSLVRFGDPAGHDIITSMLSPYTMAAPRDGILAQRLKAGDVINPGTMVGRINVSSEKIEIRSEVPGTIRQWIAADGSQIHAGQPILFVDPSPEMAWESLRALFLIGRKDDLSSVRTFIGSAGGTPTQIQQQAQLTAQAISAHAAQTAQQ
jgi:biotin carboxyl carrier protein